MSAYVFGGEERLQSSVKLLHNFSLVCFGVLKAASLGLCTDTTGPGALFCAPSALCSCAGPSSLVTACLPSKHPSSPLPHHTRSPSAQQACNPHSLCPASVQPALPLPCKRATRTPSALQACNLLPLCPASVQPALPLPSKRATRTPSTQQACNPHSLCPASVQPRKSCPFLGRGPMRPSGAPQDCKTHYYSPALPLHSGCPHMTTGRAQQGACADAQNLPVKHQASDALHVL